MALGLYSRCMTISPTSRPRTSARKPVRKHAQERFDALLDATECLLADPANEEVSLAQIAEASGVPPASVYHFFPKRNAAFVGLAQRLHAHISYNASKPFPNQPSNWQEIVEMTQRRGSAYLNAHPAALRLFMGAGVSVQVRNIDMSGNAHLTRLRAEQFNRYFDMPYLPDLESRIAIALALSDGIWALSYSLHSRITDTFIAESVRASVSYLRGYLPEVIPARKIE